MNKSKTELLAQADEIKDETQKGANTANRVGTMLNDIIDTNIPSPIQITEYSYAISEAGTFYNTFGGLLLPTLTFPDPISFVGQKITILNFAEDNMPISGNNPEDFTGIISELPTGAYVFMSINEKWYKIN